MTMWRISVIVFVVLLAGVAYSDNPPPTPAIDGQQQKSPPAKTDKKPATDQRGTEKKPFIAKSLETEKTTERTEQGRPEREEKSANERRLIVWTSVLAIATIVLALVAGGQLVMFWVQLGLIREEFISTHRPKLHVRNVEVTLPESGGLVMHALFAPHQIVRGQFYVVNIGDTPATLTGCGRWVEWRNGGLPMRRPYEGKNGNYPVSSTLQPGVSIPIFFDSEGTMGEEGDLIRQGSGAWRLYVMGWIEYTDNLKNKRRTAFCREYRMPPGRFFPMNNEPDYEHEE